MPTDTPQVIATANDRTVERTQGCWNCRHSVSGKDAWNYHRQKLLQKAAGLVQMFPEQGEDHVTVRNIRSQVDLFDHAVAMGEARRCTNRLARTGSGGDIGDLVAHNYLCANGWSAAEGASIARAGQKADPLPEELLERLDGGPRTLAEVFGGQDNSLIPSGSLIKK